jgi:hypothetical protein
VHSREVNSVLCRVVILTCLARTALQMNACALRCCTSRGLCHSSSGNHCFLALFFSLSLGLLRRTPSSGHPFLYVAEVVRKPILGTHNLATLLRDLIYSYCRILRYPTCQASWLYSGNDLQPSGFRSRQEGWSGVRI